MSAVDQVGPNEIIITAAPVVRIEEPEQKTISSIDQLKHSNVNPDNVLINRSFDKRKWSTGLCECSCGLTCMAAILCLPCYYGRVARRLDTYPFPPDVRPFHYCNGDCFLFWLLAPAASFLPSCLALSWIPGTFLRKAHRRQHGIEGNLCSDFVTALCCQPCALAQQDRDLKDRAEAELPTAHRPSYIPITYFRRGPPPTHRPFPPKKHDLYAKEEQMSYSPVMSVGSGTGF